jgi:hypothetical protein
VEETLEKLPSKARLELVLQVLEWTRDALPSSSRALVADEAGKTVDAAMDLVRRSVSGAAPGDSTEDVLDELFEWSDDLRVERLWQLFNALTYCVGVRADDATAEMALETMSACYDVIRDGERLPEFAVGTPEEKVFAVERANANCMNAS